MLNSYVPTLRNMYGLRFGDRLLTLPVAILLYHNLKEETVVMFFSLTKDTRPSQLKTVIGNLITCIAFANHASESPVNTQLTFYISVIIT